MKFTFDLPDPLWNDSEVFFQALEDLRDHRLRGPADSFEPSLDRPPTTGTLNPRRPRQSRCMA